MSETKKQKKGFGLYNPYDGSSCGSKRIREIGNGADEFYEADGPDGALKFWVCLIIVVSIITIIGYIVSNM